MTTRPSIRVLVVDDEIDHADVMAEAIARMPGGGFSVKTAHNLADAKRHFSTEDFDLVITDLRMDSPNDGLDLLHFVRHAQGAGRPQTEVIVVTAHGDVPTSVEAMRNGAY